MRTSPGPTSFLDFEFQDFLINLAIRNIGTTPARDVKFAFDKPLQVPSDTHDEGDFDIFKRPIPMMAPGRVIRVAFGSALEFFAEERPDVPFRYVVEAKYTDLAGNRTYEDPPIYLDLASYENTLASSDHIKDVATHLKNIDRHMKSWTTQNGLRVRAFDQERLDRRGRRTRQRQRDKRLRAEQGWLALVIEKGQAWRRRRAR